MREDAWLAARFGHAVFTIDDDDSVADVSAHACAHAGAFYQTKVDAHNVARVGALEEAGFRVVDVNLTLERSPGIVDADPTWEVGDPRAGDRDELLRLAAEDYTVSRFHLDPAVSAAQAAAIKRDWVLAYLEGERGERLLVARRAGSGPVGFLAVLSGPDTRMIDLIAVRVTERGAGAGRALVAALLADSEDRYERVAVGTQVANGGALRFYQRLGFTARQTRYVLHLHAGHPASAARVRG